MTQQFYPIKLEDARGLYERGLLSTSGFLYLFLKIRLAPGWKITLQQREISQQLGISRSQFYRAIHKLSDEGLIDWEAPNGLVVTVKVSSDERNSATPNEAELCRTELSYAERNSVTPSETPVAPSETKTPVKPSSVKDFTSSSDSYQIFFKSLSDKAREKFFNFVREKISEFSKPIHDVQGWLAGKNQAGIERFRVYYEMFQKEMGEVFAPSQDWANHPKYQEWLSALSRYPKGFPYMDDFPGSRDEKKAFAEWALGNSLVWGNKTWIFPNFRECPCVRSPNPDTKKKHGDRLGNVFAVTILDLSYLT